ncbi:uncharacterized protein FOBCDRAFT_243100 [Fusarium oxysporum Fo47]|uniref:uncharacterized protein n=1 Tax=Fusarium oxysporum Fo47 TaxID=660027 RepID=UPI002869E67C|nr:uncharacterized protein FOBCDRAFT_243100 [Fusarium oxysporum Fo47]WJG36084.1 hypothetical protein FOBCDRAFT_243100 [Fusarium oxysporum Fo47]
MKNSLAASAGLKAQHIFLTSCNDRAQHSEHSDDGNNPIVPARLPLALDPSQLTRIDMLSSTIGSALYQEATVLIEEKRVQSNMKGKIKPHTFPCLRYIEERGGFRLVFQFPSSTEKARSLLSVLSRSNGPLPDVGTRFSLAVQVCQKLLSSHTAGWLHKDLRFENILPIPSLSAQSTDRLDRPYLCGFSVARQEWTTLRKIVKKRIDTSSSVDVKLSGVALLSRLMHGRYITEGVAAFRLRAVFMNMLALCIPARDEKPIWPTFTLRLKTWPLVTFN